MKTKLIRIELLSDLAAGSGYAFNATIDSDIVFDDTGLPYIPSRRLKGVMREAAENISLILEYSVGSIFGRTKENENTGFMIEDGVIKGCESIRGVLKKEKDIHDQQVLGLFTTVRTQTKMVDGIADDNSLRKTRLVNRYSPLEKGKNLEFYAPITYKEEMEVDIENILSAVKAIGLKRNRGLGSVKCSLTDCPEPRGFVDETTESCLSIMVEVQNELPMMISAGSDTKSESYIPARNMIGALASMYLKSGKEAGDEFADLFLNGKTAYTNLYPADHNGRYVPAPAFIQKRKASGNINNILLVGTDQSKADNNSLKDEGVPKKLTGKYAILKDDKHIFLKETDKRIIYHHRRDDDAGLYTSTALSEGQTFAGTVTFSTIDQKKIIMDLLKRGVLRFGKSKTAQYGKCRIVNISDGPQTEKRAFKKDDILLVCLASDALFMNANGYTVNFNEIYDQVAAGIGLNESQYIHLDQTGRIPGDEKLMSYTSTTMEYGYQSTWNMRKAPVPAITAGSTFVYKLCADAETVNNAIGVRTYEGYGEVNVYELNDCQDTLELMENDLPDETENSREAKQILCTIYQEKLYGEVRDLMLGEVSTPKISLSSIGRATLMVKESSEMFADKSKAYAEFRKRVNSIKSDGTKAEIQGFVNGYFDKDGNLSQKFTGSIEKRNSYEKLKEYGGKPENFIFKRWDSLLLECLSKMKYMNKEKGK